MPNEKTPLTISDREFVRRLVLTTIAVGLVLVLWTVSDIFLLFFGSILGAILIVAAADLMRRQLPISEKVAITGVIVLMFAVFAISLVLLGPILVAQLDLLADRLPGTLQGLQEELGLGPFVKRLTNGVTPESISSMAAGLAAWGFTLASGFGGVLLIGAGSMYLAYDPERYRSGFVALMPPAVQDNVAAALSDSGIALKRWLAGQLLAMLIVGGLTALGLWLIGVPSALALGLIAGVLEFIPVLGPLIAAVPIALLAAGQDLSTLAFALLLMFIIQQLENIIIMPLIVGRVTFLPAAIGLFSVIALGLLLGPLGLLLGYPLSIVLDAVIRRLYLRDTLGSSVKTADQATASDAAQPAS